MSFLPSAVLTAVLLAGPALPQAALGIAVQGPAASFSNIACGFDCTLPGHALNVPLTSGQPVHVHLFGDANLPAALVIGYGAALSGCPGLVLPGIGNSLFVLPPNILLALQVPPLQAVGRAYCASGGSTVALAQLLVPPSAAGATLTWQGLVYDGRRPAFTRPIETPIR